jgi:hypothetical protein
MSRAVYGINEPTTDNKNFIYPVAYPLSNAKRSSGDIRRSMEFNSTPSGKTNVHMYPST